MICGAILFTDSFKNVPIELIPYDAIYFQSPTYSKNKSGPHDWRGYGESAGDWWPGHTSAQHLYWCPAPVW